MTWTPIRDKKDAAFRAALVLVYLALIAGTVLACWTILPAVPANIRGYVIAFVCGYVLAWVVK